MNSPCGGDRGVGTSSFPIPCNLGTRPVFLGSFAFFRLKNSAQCCIIFPVFSRFPPFWESRFPAPLLLPPVHLTSLKETYIALTGCGPPEKSRDVTATEEEVKKSSALNEKEQETKKANISQGINIATFCYEPKMVRKTRKCKIKCGKINFTLGTTSEAEKSSVMPTTRVQEMQKALLDERKDELGKEKYQELKR